MKSISDYTIYCTKEQTKKALELDAPICCIWNGFYEGDEKEVPYFREIRHGIEQKIKPPTAEQMIGWLEEQGIMIDITHQIDGYCHIKVSTETKNIKTNIEGSIHRSIATLAAIDAALGYLAKRKEE